MNKEQHTSPPRGRSHGKQLDTQTWLLLVINALYMTANALSGTFLGVYIWKASHDFGVVGWMAIWMYLVMGLTFWIAGAWVKKGHLLMSLRIGIGCSAIFYAIVLFLGTKAVHWIVLLGSLQGVSAGLFWLTFNVFYFEVTNVDNRDRFNGLTGVFTSMAGMLAPWLSGWMIAQLGGERGYRTIFMIALGIYVVGVVVSLFLRARRAEGVYEWGLPLRLLRESMMPWPSILGALVAQGMREGVFGMMIALLVFINTGSEMKLGNYTLITSGVGFLSNYVIGRWLKQEWRSRGMLIGTVMITLIIVPFLFQVNFTTLLIFGIGSGLFFPLYMIPMTSSVFDLIGRDEQSARQRVEYVVARELALNVGRLLGLTILLITLEFSRAPIVMSSLMLGIGCAPLIGWWFMRHQLAPQLNKDVR